MPDGDGEDMTISFKVNRLHTPTVAPAQPATILQLVASATTKIGGGTRDRFAIDESVRLNLSRR